MLQDQPKGRARQPVIDKHGRREPNLYVRQTAAGKVYEVSYRDSTGRQVLEKVGPNLTEARDRRDAIRVARNRGERVQANPTLRFRQAADRWLGDQVAQLRPATQAIYRNAVENHLAPRWGSKRLDAITVSDAAKLVRDMRAAGKSEWTISGVLKAASRIFKFADRHLAWHGQNPISQLENGERPKVGAAQRRRIYVGDELEQTLAAAHEPYKTLFALAASTGARLSEILGVTWQDVTLSGDDGPEIEFLYQVDRQGRRQPLKTEESQRTVPLIGPMAAMLAEHKLRARDTRPGAFVFATVSGRALQQRNVMRELRRAQKKATDAHGRPTFPILHERDANGDPVPVPHGAVPSFHSYRHTAASEAISAGESAEDVSFLLGHKNSVVTRTVYTHEIRSRESKARRRGKMDARYASVLSAAARSNEAQAVTQAGADVVELSQIRDAAQ